MRRGGGVLIAIINTFNPKLIDSGIESESLFVEFNINKRNYLICSLYLPASPLSQTHFDEFLQLVNSHSMRYDPDNIIICGDFNLAHIDWTAETIYDENTPVEIKNRASTLLQTTSFLGLNQLFPILPSKSYTLDLFFATHDKFKYIDLNEQIVKSDSHHQACFFEATTTVTKDPILNPSRRNYYLGDYESINNSLQSMQWNELFIGKNIDERVSIFNNTIHSLIEKFIPMLNDKPSPYPPSFNHDLIDTIIAKKIAHTNWKMSNLESDKINFNRLRSTVYIFPEGFVGNILKN